MGASRKWVSDPYGNCDRLYQKSNFEGLKTFISSTYNYLQNVVHTPISQSFCLFGKMYTVFVSVYVRCHHYLKWLTFGHATLAVTTVTEVI